MNRVDQLRTPRFVNSGITKHQKSHDHVNQKSCGFQPRQVRSMDKSFGASCLTVPWILLLVVGLVGWCAGCKHKVTVALDESLRQAGMMPSLEIDIVGVNNSEQDRWRHYSVTQYFSAGDLFRQDADRYTMSFADTDAAPKTLGPKDPIWKVWRRKSAKCLVVLAHLPGDHPDLPGEQDARRLILPLPDDKATSIVLVVKKSGVESLTD